jgi:hypothetical protein
VNIGRMHPGGVRQEALSVCFGNQFKEGLLVGPRFVFTSLKKQTALCRLEFREVAPCERATQFFG